MIDFLKVKNNFHFTFFTSRYIYAYYSNIFNCTSKQDYFNRSEGIKDYSKKDIIVINNIPAYLEARINQDNGPYKFFKIHYLDGFLINLKDFVNLDDYMKAQFGPKSRSKLRKYVKRLELCFDIRYEMYYGEITNEKFHLLMDALQKMISNRFLQRGDTHESLKKWDYYKLSAYGMILEKKASLFVIYDGDKPIDICLNYHHQNILYCNIQSYDIDYSKFGLGSIGFIKLLEWCFSNNYTILDLSHGNLDYKYRWSNSIYIFEHHVIYNYRKINKQITAYTIFHILKLKAFLKKRKVDVLYHSIKNKIKGISRKNQAQIVSSFRVENFSSAFIKDTTIYPIDINQNEFAFLRKAVYDFQYLSFESKETITVFKISGTDNSYIIQGKERRIMLALTKKEIT